MTKLNQIIAIEKGIKSNAHSVISDLHKTNQKPALFNGFVRTYRKKDEEGEDLPQERQRVQFTTEEVLRTIERTTGELIDITARKDYTNCVASADVVVDGHVIVTAAPVSFLLFLEKQLTDLRTFVSNLPILDEAENWTKDENSGLFKSDVISTHRTKKVVKPIVRYPATPEHPAQTDLINEDILVGFWDQTKFSGAMPKPERENLVEKIEKLLRATKEAREAANMTDESAPSGVAQNIFNFLLEA